MVTNHLMNNIKYAIVLGLIALLFSSNSFASPNIQHWVSKNGARIYFVEAPELPMLDISISFDAGSARDGDKAGIGALLNSLLDEGAGELNADQIAEQLEGLGAELSNSTDYDMASVSLRSLTHADNLKPALAIFATLLHQPRFPEDGFERERKRMLSAIQKSKQSPRALANKAFYQAIYGDHPYGSPVSGTEASLKTITIDDLKAHYLRLYVARNASIAMVGAISRDQAERITEQLTQKFTAGTRPKAIPAARVLTQAQLKHIDFPSTQTHILMGQTGMHRNDPDYHVLYVGNHILGGSGLVSRISEEIREKRGLSYSAYSYFYPLREDGPFVIGLQTRNDNTDEAIQVATDTVEQFIKNGPTDKELEASKMNITGGFPLRISSNRKILNYLSVIGFYQLPLDYLDTFNQHVEAVTIEQIRETFKRRINTAAMVTVTVGNRPETTSDTNAETAAH